MVINETYDESVYSTRCRNCSTDNQFTMDRELIERRYLDLGDGYVDIDSEDTDQYDEWKFACQYCGNSGSELIDLLEELPDEDEDGEEDFPQYL